MVKPSSRREMAKQAVVQSSVPIKLAFGISESCYRYECWQSAENDKTEDWLIRLTDNNSNWGFGLCYLYLTQRQRLWLEQQARIPH